MKLPVTPIPIPVTVAIPVRNEEANLAHCLGRLGRFAEVLVIDSGSTDGTAQIAEDHGTRVLQFSWTGSYPKKRNWFLMNHPPSQAWVLFLDADEFVDDAFCEAVSRALRDEQFNGYWLTYANYFLGKRLKYGLEQRKLALFRVGKGLYERIDEEDWSGLDMEIHEHPIIDGPVGEIRAPIDHRDYKGLAKFIDRHRDYASGKRNATSAFRLTKRLGPASHPASDLNIGTSPAGGIRRSISCSPMLPSSASSMEQPGSSMRSIRPGTS